MSAEIVKWKELTPEARLAMWDEAERLLAIAPNQETVPMVRSTLLDRPYVIPYWIENMKILLKEA
jgi:hypothetical protein